MNPDTSTLKDLVEVLNDGKTFYEDAAAKVNRPELRDLFRRMAGTKAAIVSDLQSKIVQRGVDAPDGNSVAGTLLKAWGELRVSISSAPNVEYVSQLEDFEDRIVATFKHAADKSEDADVRAIAARHMPQVLRDHSEMRALKLEFKRAS
ncbi:MAG: PA2169 family four-helix-bundle protein [Rudaea sp.]